jgi:DNA gyrase subunit A
MITNDLVHELGTNFIEYAVAVNTDRAIPDALSGLKPVAKRILWSSFESGRTYSKPHVKAARIVGDVMGKYHPHGDSSIYGAMVRLSQDWVMRYPLIDWHGNNGNIAGDGPAAARYTEARLSKIAEDGMLAGIKKNNVDFIPNYSEDADEPVTLPAIFPNLLCNPNSGIGVAMACNWLPHNLKEVAQAIYDYMDGKEPMLPGPDFPTGGIVINKNDIPAIMKTGHGSVKVRARYKVEKGNLVFYEIPYGTTIEGLMSEIGAVCDAKEIEGIAEIRDESNKKGLRIVVICQKGIDPDSIAKKLYLKTNLQTSISYNQVALIDKTPTELNLKQCIKLYVDHNVNCVVKEATFDLAKAKARQEIVDGLLRALEDIDNIIAFIKKSASSAAAKDGLIKEYKFTEPQAKAIIDMKLGKLASLEKVELNEEKAELDKSVIELSHLIESREDQEKTVRERLESIVKKYGDDRRTELDHIEIKPEEKEIETVTPEDVVVIISNSGEIKRVAKSSFRVQRKGGKGVKTEDDAILDTIATNTIDTLLAFTNTGKMYRLLVDNIPAGTNVSKGVGIGSLINMEPTEKVIAVTTLERKNNKKYVIFITKKGLLKKTLLEEYIKTKRSTGIAAIKIKDGDSIANIEIMDEEEMIIITKKGQCIHIDTKDVSAIGRATSGIKAIKLAEDDEVLVGLPIINKNEQLAVFTKYGYGKKTNLDEFPLQGKNGKGVIIYKETPGTGPVVGAAMVSETDNLLLSGKNAICIAANEVPLLGRTATGNIMIKQGEIGSIIKL